MRILQINTVCDSGSIARIMKDLYENICREGHECCIAYGRGSAIAGMECHKIGTAAGVATHVFRNFFMGESGFGSTTDTARFLKWIDEYNPDVIHIHNLHGFYINVEMFFDYIKKKNVPVVWTLHDCWPFTGHCAYYNQIDCKKWQEHCDACSIHRISYPYALFKENSYASYDRKRAAFLGVQNLRIITPSKWLEAEVKKSFLKGYSVVSIPNGIDTGIFRITDWSLEEEIILPKDRYMVLGVANHWESRKGLKYFEQLAKDIPESFYIVLVGVTKKQKKDLERKYPQKIFCFQRTKTVEKLVALYNRADIFVNPTLADNFPTTNLEALACGTPVYTFDVGGSKEAVNDFCGRIIHCGDYAGLLSDILKFESMEFDKTKCREQAEKYDKYKQYGLYMDVYRKMDKE